MPEYTGLDLNPSPRVLWLRLKTLSQCTLAQDKDPLQEYSGTGPNPSPSVLWQKVLWDRLKSLSQTTLGGGYEPVPEYSGRALQSEDYHLPPGPPTSSVGSSSTATTSTLPCNGTKLILLLSLCQDSQVGRQKDKLTKGGLVIFI